MKQETILITGAAGFIGSQLTRWLTEHTEHNVVGVDDLSGGYMENLPLGKLNFIFLQRNCINRESMRTVFENHRPDIVYHFAAYAAEGLSPFIRMFNYTNNLIATANIVNLCIEYNVKRLVFTSSMAVYGKGLSPFSESDHCNPIDPYGVAKLACEMDIKIAGEQHGLDWCIIRPHNCFGPAQNIWDKYRNVLGIWMNQHLNGKPMTIYGDGQQRRAFSYIGDILKPLYIAGTSPEASKEIINLGGTSAYTILFAAQELSLVMGGGADVEFLSARHEVKEAFSTHKKSEMILGYKENTSLYIGLHKMWDWAKGQPKRKTKTMAYEITKGIYGYWQ